jgi:hypothetical protein
VYPVASRYSPDISELESTKNSETKNRETKTKDIYCLACGGAVRQENEKKKLNRDKQRKKDVYCLACGGVVGVCSAVQPSNGPLAAFFFV